MKNRHEGWVNKNVGKYTGENNSFEPTQSYAINFKMCKFSFFTSSKLPQF